MSLLGRLGGFGTSETEGKLPIEYFWAALYELAQGVVTKAQIVALFDLDTDEAAELQWIIDKYNAQPTATAKAKFVELILVILILAEAGAPGYQSQTDVVARINAI